MSELPDMSELVVFRAASLKDKKPVEMTLGEIAEQHLGISGYTGSGKDQRAVMQLVRNCQKPFTVKGVPQKAAVVVFDSGQDNCLCWGAEEAAREHKRAFRLLTASAEEASATFKVFPEDLHREGNVAPFAASLAHALGASSMEFEHGPFYYAMQQVGGMITAVEEMKRGREVPTLALLKRKLGGHTVRRNYPDSGSLLAVLNLLQCYPALNYAPGESDDVVDPDEVIDQGQTVYVSAGTMGDPGAKIFQSVILQTFIATLRRRRRLGKRGFLVLCIEEAAALMGPAFADMVAQLRKFHGIIIASWQLSDQLQTRERDLRPLVNSNMARLMFSVGSEWDVRWLQSLSKRRPYPMETRSTGMNLLDQRVGETDQMRPLLDENRILDVSATPGQCFLIRRHDRHVEPEQLFVPFSLSYEQFDEWSHKPLPPKVRSAADVARENERAEALSRMQELFAELEQDHSSG